jgi:hypothetical protein
MVTRTVVLLVVASAVLGGCGGAGATDTGTHAATAPHLTVAAGWSGFVGGWERTLHAAARHNPRMRFPTPSANVFRRRLARASSDFRFRIVSLRFVRAPQGAPLVIIQATSPEAVLAREVPAIMRMVDPHRPAREDWLGWAYEGIFLGAQSRRGSPFLDVSNVMRFHTGGQWALRNSLFPYPYAHG